MTVIEAQEVKYPIGGADPDNRLRVYRALRSELPDIEGMVHHQVVPYGFESRQSDQGEYQTVLRVGRDPANKKQDIVTSTMLSLEQMTSSVG